MRKIKIVSDSACDIFSLPAVDFASAPMKLITAEREFVDNEALDVDEMVDFLDKYKGKSKSSCPNTSDWISAFGDADEVFCTTITGALSGSCNSANTAKKVYESQNEGKRVFVIDTLSTGPEIMLILEKLEELAKSGLSYEDICREITEYQKKTGLLFMLKSLKNLANNGRVSPLIAKAIGILGICIVGKASDEGTLEQLHKCRGERNSIKTLLESLEKEGYCGGMVSIGYCKNESAALGLKSFILEKHGGASVDIHKLRGLCSFYAENGGILVGFEK